MNTLCISVTVLSVCTLLTATIKRGQIYEFKWQQCLTQKRKERITANRLSCLYSTVSAISVCSLYLQLLWGAFCTVFIVYIRCTQIALFYCVLQRCVSLVHPRFVDLIYYISQYLLLCYFHVSQLFLYFLFVIVCVCFPLLFLCMLCDGKDSVCRSSIKINHQNSTSYLLSV